MTGPPTRASTPVSMPLPGWQQAIRREVRQLVHAAGSPVTETIKRTNRPCFVTG